MNNEQAKEVLSFANDIQQQAYDIYRPPEDTGPSKSQHVITHSIVRKSRGYIESIVHQINGTYEHGWFDACAVMIRKLLETLIIEVFEAHGISSTLKNPQGHFLYLSELIPKTLAETTFNISRNAQTALPKLKNVGDRSAHNRRYVAQRKDIDNIRDDLRDIVQEFLYLAGFK
ncbi:hypothetical protein [Herpetosiphon sp. NSE202]|uniref:hypothetical protein n=1 Tax=Herpetosiphon sp. NSE202 TaxID=3351349 RepID=UPI0036426D96